MLRLAIVGLVALMVCGLVVAEAKDKKTVAKGAKYIVDKVIMLEVSRPIVLEVMSGDQKLLATAKLPIDNSTFTATGDSKNDTSGGLITNTLTIAYNKPIPLENSTGKLNDVKLVIVTTLYKNTSYWKISDMTVSYSGNPEADGTLWVDKVPGYLQQGPWNCARGFTSCAPKALSWTCDEQKFVAKALDPKKNDKDKENDQDKDSTKNGVVVTFPGMQLQPFYGGAKTRFGFNWDCDPLISSALWVTLLLGLALIVALYWSCDMIANLTTPDRFDDPKKTQPIMVPSAE